MIVEEVHTTKPIRDGLVELLVDCVDSGASVGFISPMRRFDAEAYWDSVEKELAAGSRRLLVASESGAVVGAVQLSLPGKANGSHRAEVEKLMVHTTFRGAGAGRQLMQAAEACAANNNRQLLVLDTRLGDVASDLYRKLGYIEAGQIPCYARSSSGELDSTVFFYKQLPNK